MSERCNAADGWLRSRIGRVMARMKHAGASRERPTEIGGHNDQREEVWDVFGAAIRAALILACPAQGFKR